MQYACSPSVVGVSVGLDHGCNVCRTHHHWEETAALNTSAGTGEDNITELN